MKKFLIIPIILLMLSVTMNAEEKNFIMPASLGFYAGINYNMHSPDFTFLDTTFLGRNLIFNENANGIRLNAGIIFNYPLSDYFVLSGRLGYNGVGSDLPYGKAPFVFGPDTVSTSDMSTSLDYIEFSPILQFHNLLPLKRLYFLAGLEFGFPVSTNYMYNVDRKIGGTTETREVSNDIDEASVRFSAALGAGYVFNLDDNTFLTPEISFRLPFTRVSSADKFDSWSAPQLRAGISLTFSLEGDDKVPDKSSSLKVGFNDVSYYDKEGNRNDLSKIVVEEVQYTELFPFVPYVFADENDQYPSKSTQVLSAEAEAGEFSMQTLEPDAMKINMHTLDIIGNRMSQIEKGTLTITGTIDGRIEKNTPELSKKRAEFAKNYLVINYGIDPNRIVATATGVPSRPSSLTDPDGISENRRIEFSSDNYDLIEPILIEKDKQAIASPDMIEFAPYIISTDSITRWELSVVQGNRSLQSFSGTGDIMPLRWNILPNELSAGDLPVEYTLYAENEAGLESSESGSVPVDFYSISRKKIEDRPDRTISKFSLILFDFDKAETSAQNLNILEQNVLPAIQYNSTVQIYGYTDRIGNEDYNMKLAEKRALVVKDFIQKKAPSAKYEVYGVGEKNLIFDNNLPVGRQLSRTVQIYVVTPKE